MRHWEVDSEAVQALKSFRAKRRIIVISNFQVGCTSYIQSEFKSHKMCKKYEGFLLSSFYLYIP
jgi:hypothetical protein